MKVTIDMAGDLLASAKRLAASQGTTLSGVIERALPREVADTGNGHVLVDATFTGSGLQAGIDEGNWASRRESIYGGRGS